jgi:hypothetical protein
MNRNPGRKPTVLWTRVGIVFGPVAGTAYGLAMFHRHQSRSQDASLLALWVVAVYLPGMLTVVLPGVVLLRKIAMATARRVLWRLAVLALSPPCGWLLYVTLSQWGDADEWFFLALAVLPCVVIVGSVAWYRALTLRDVSDSAAAQ